MSRYDLPKKIPDKYYGLLLQILMLENKIGDHVLIAFTGDEEIESRGAQEVKR